MIQPVANEYPMNEAFVHILRLSRDRTPKGVWFAEESPGEPLVPPKILEPIGFRLRIADCTLDVAMPEVGPGVDAGLAEFEPAGVAQHMGGCLLKGRKRADGLTPVDSNSAVAAAAVNPRITSTDRFMW